MSISTIQATGAGGAWSVPASTIVTENVSAAFTSNNTGGNTILVWIFGACVGAGSSVSAVSISDTAGNVYASAFNSTPGGNNNGGWIGLFIAKNIAAGANTVTFDATINTSNIIGASVTMAFIAAEYSGMPNPVLQSHAQVQIFGSAGNSPSVLTITDSFGASVSATFETSGGMGIGTINASAGLADLMVSGVNYLTAGCQGQTASIIDPPVSPSGYQTFIQEFMLNKADGANYQYLWDSASPVPTIAQPQVFVVT